MSGRYNTRHFRTSGGYRRRLERRGLKSAPAMEDAETLAKRQSRRVAPWAEDGERITVAAPDLRPGGGQ